jgi:hypothetical protein
MPEEPSRYAFCLLPYVRFEESLEIAHVNFLPLSQSRDRLPPEVYEYLQRVRATYLDGNASEVPDLTLAYIDPLVRASYSDAEWESIRTAADVLCYLFVSRNRILPLHSDHFRADRFEGHPTNERLSFTFARIQHLGYNLRTPRSYAPLFVRSELLSMNTVDENLHGALAALHAGCTVGNRQRECRQILQALHWFNLAEAVKEYDQPHTQVLQQSIAFETLLDPPHEGITEYFRKTVGLLVGIPEVDKWAKDFYSVRSRTVHGEQIAPTRYLYGEHRHVGHYELGKAVFAHCLRMRLQLWGLYEAGRLNTWARVNDIREMLTSNRTRLAIIQDLLSKDLSKDLQKRRELEHTLSGLRLEDRSLRPKDVEQLRKCVATIKARRTELENIVEADIADVEYFLEMHGS